MHNYSKILQELRDKNLFRELTFQKRNGISMICNRGGRSLVDFSSNDYLGLSRHPLLIQKGQQALLEYGVGSTGSRLLSGDTIAHEECETYLAQCKRTERALLFSSGYAAAMAILPSLMGKEDVIIMDKLIHACLIDGAKASGARIRVFPHNSISRLEKILSYERDRMPFRSRILILVESVYSMDGDCTLLTDIVELKERYGAMLLVDEAHALGVLGTNGMGLIEEEKVQGRVDLQMGTLGKAAGGMGGYVACSKVLQEMIINHGRSFIYSTAIAPMQAAVAYEGMRLIQSEEGMTLRKRLLKYRTYVGNLLGRKTLPSAICPLMIGDSGAALALSESMLQLGVRIPAVRYPTVSRETARLRVTLSAAHTSSQIGDLGGILEKITATESHFPYEG